MSSTASQLWLPPNNAFQPDRIAHEITVFEASIRREHAAAECGGVMPQAPSDPVATATPVFDFGEFPVLTTPRLSLCEYSTDYLEDIFAVRSDPVVQLYNSAPHQTRAETLTFIEQERENYRLKKEVIWAVRLQESGRVIGSISVFDWDRYHRHAALGYDLARDCWGQGYAQEAIRGVLRFAFEALLLNRVEIWTSVANERSLKLAERLGFTREGTLRRRILEDDGQLHDCAVFGLVRAEWSNARGSGPA